MAGHFEAKNVARARRRRIDAQALEDVRPVDACGGHPDPHFTLCRCRAGSRLKDQRIGPTGGRDRYGRHGLRH